MKKITIKISIIHLSIIIVFLFVNCYTFAQTQNNNQYKMMIDSAHVAIVTKQDSVALKYYERAFSTHPVKKPIEFYEAASVCARLQLTDKCFMFLNMAIDKGLSGYYYDHLKNNKYYSELKDDYRFHKCLDMLKANDSLSANVNSQLAKIFNTDQYIRKHYRKQQKEELLKDSMEAKQILEIIQIVDAYNLSEVEKIINKYGILGNSLVIKEAREAIPTVYLHAPTEAQKSILKKMKKAVDEGEINASDYAYLEDKIMIEDAGFQKYGSQYRIENNQIVLFPLIEPEKVNLYRKEVGLNTLEEYLDYVKKRVD